MCVFLMWGETYVVAGEVVDGRFGQHAVVCTPSSASTLFIARRLGLEGNVHSNSDFLNGGVLPAMMISLALPERSVLSVDL